jgi:ApbE superfamily uncharacterized protein (UPF0280 family)
LAAYQERDYRVACRQQGLVAFTARVKETDLWIRAERDLTQEAVDSILAHRRGLEAYISGNPDFLHSLVPLPQDDLAPPLARKMIWAGQQAGVGPMAAVAGAVAEAVAVDLMRHSPQVAVENGGDTFLALSEDVTVGLWAGKSPLSGKVGLAISAASMPLSVCTSSATVGHSLSLGRADAATIVAKDAALADAAATALGNRAGSRGELAAALKWVQTVPGVLGALIILDDRLAAWGEIELVEIKGAQGK